MFARIESFSIKKSPSLCVPAMSVFPANASEVTASPILIGVSHTEDATSRRSMFSER